MPHQCTDCGRRFDDGSKEMLSGCPDCGGNTFQFHPKGRAGTDSGGQEPPPETPEPPEPAVNSSVARTVGNAATAVRDLVGGDDPPAGHPASSRAETPEQRPDSAPSPEPRPDSAPKPSDSGSITADREDAAQASARTEVVSPDDLPPAPERSVRERPAPVVDETSESTAEERPDLDELRKQLNQQFESIRVVAPGQYELNLMGLFDREEYIIALQEDGKYTIQVPERWGE